jgi:hypothetical protein
MQAIAAGISQTPVDNSNLSVGGVFNKPLCFDFAVAMNGITRAHLNNLHMIAAGTQDHTQAFNILIDRVRMWKRELLVEETESWLCAVPVLRGLYEYTYHETLRAYASLYPSIKEMGIRMPGLSDFVFCYLVHLYKDPLVKAGEFCEVDHARSLSIVIERTAATISEAIVAMYFPKYASAVSDFARHEPMLNPQVFREEEQEEWRGKGGSGRPATSEYQ